MKTQQRRDEQAVTIAASLPVIAIAGAAVWAAVDVVDVVGADAGVLLLVGVALAALGLARRRRGGAATRPSR